MGGHKGLAAATCCTTAPNRAVHSATATRKEAVAAPDLPWLQRGVSCNISGGVSARDRDECGGGSGPIKGGRTPHFRLFFAQGEFAMVRAGETFVTQHRASGSSDVATLGSNTRKRNPPATARM